MPSPVVERILATVCASQETELDLRSFRLSERDWPELVALANDFTQVVTFRIEGGHSRLGDYPVRRSLAETPSLSSDRTSG